MVAALFAVLTAWLPADAGARQRRVVVVGDSVILGAEAPLSGAFAQRGWAVTFDAAVSRSTGAGLQAIESHRSELTDSLVVSLGANDAGNPSAFRQRVQAILDATAAVPHVYWVTLREVRDYYAPANQIVRELAAGRPNVTVLDWHGATVGATDLTAGDGLHLNGAGAARMTQMVTDAVISGSALPPATAPAPAPAPAAPAAPAPAAPVAPEPVSTSAALPTIGPAATASGAAEAGDVGRVAAGGSSAGEQLDRTGERAAGQPASGERAAGQPASGERAAASSGSDGGVGGVVVPLGALFVVGALAVGVWRLVGRRIRSPQG